MISKNFQNIEKHSLKNKVIDLENLINTYSNQASRFRFKIGMNLDISYLKHSIKLDFGYADSAALTAHFEQVLIKYKLAEKVRRLVE